MDLEEEGSLSARSTSSLEDGASSSRSKKSKTLARLRKLKKAEKAALLPSTDGVIPHPPSSGKGEGLVNGHIHTSPPLDAGFVNRPEPIENPKADSIFNEVNPVPAVDSKPSNLNDPLDFREKPRSGVSLFSSPLEPLKPTRRGLGGLEPLVPRSGLEPLDFTKKVQPRTNLNHDFENVNHMAIPQNHLQKSEPDIVEGLDDQRLVRNNEDVVKVGGVVEDESNDALEVDLPDKSYTRDDKDSWKDSSVVLPSEESMPYNTHHIKHTVSESDKKIFDSNSHEVVDPLPDNAEVSGSKSEVTHAVSSSLKERTLPTSHTDFKEELVSENISEHQNSNAPNGEKHPTKSTSGLSAADDSNDESDDDLIIVSASSNSKSPKPEIRVERSATPEAESTPIWDDIRAAMEDDLASSQRTLTERRDGGEEKEEEEEEMERLVEGCRNNNNDEEDERKLKQYLASKLQELNEEDQSQGGAMSSTGSLSRAGRLSPITAASTPPPLHANFMSPGLRTAYKRDDLEDSLATSEMSGESLADTNRSMSLLLNPMTNRGARNRNRSYLSGGVRNAGSLVGKEELDSHLPDRKLRIFVTTWNMHEDKEIPGNLDDLLLPSDCEYMQDIYVIGSQESCPDITEWEVRLQETLGPMYVLLHSASHGVLHCAVFIRRDLIWFCSPVEESRVSTRPGSMVKTKGAIALSFNFFGTSFIFIVSHFTSGDENMKDRLADYEKTLKGISLPEKVPPTRKFNVLTSDVTTRFDCVFWCGDLNFRLGEDKPRVEGWIDQLRRGTREDYDVLLQHDQLIKAMKRGDIFQGFREGEINFLPSYKFDLGEDVYDTSPKARVPSYTDRVLYKSRRASDISLVHYSSCEEIKTSDHRPVYALFEAGVRPGKDSTSTAGGMFSRPVYIEGIRRRVAKAGMSKGTQASSAVCSVM